MGPSVGVKAREGFGEAISSSLDEIVELAWIDFTGESGKACLKALTVLSRDLLANMDGLEIPYNQAEKAVLLSLCHSFQVSILLFMLFCLLYILYRCLTILAFCRPSFILLRLGVYISGRGKILIMP